MFRNVVLACLLAAFSVPAWAGNTLLQGLFTEDDDAALIPFTISADNVVTIESYGYAGGTAPGGILVPEGGFPTTIVLYDSLGAEIGSDNGGHCGITGTDSVTGNCDDAYFEDSLTKGSYTLALIETDNVPNGNLADGFKQDGNPGFTCAEFGLTGNFCDTTTATGDVIRTGNYAVAISSDSLVTPEPSSFILISAAGVFAAALRLKKKP